MKTFLIIGLLLLFSSLYSQQEYTTRNKKAISKFELAQRHYGLLDYTLAAENLLEATRADQYFIEAWLFLAQVYTDAGKIEESIAAYKVAASINPTFFPNAMFFLAENEFSLGLYQDARHHYRQFLSMGVKKEKMKKGALIRLASCEFAIVALANPVPFEPFNLGPGINSSNDEYWPSLSADESIMFYTRLIPIDEGNPTVRGNRHEDLYYSEYSKKAWQPSQDAGSPPNTPDNEGAQSISGNGRFMVFTACGRSDGYGMCDIYYAIKKGNKWTTPRNIGPSINTNLSEKQPALSSDGRRLYFTSNRAGGLGEYDIWVSSFQADGSWSEPHNLGSQINTAGFDQSPFIHPDNRTLYFSSTNWPGMGGFDIFMAEKTGDTTWSRPMNLGYPINTHFHEEGLIVNARGNMAYFSSNRLSEKGRDIFSFELYDEARPNRVSYMKGKVFDAYTHKLLKAEFELIDLDNSRTVIASSSDEGSGEFLVVIPIDTDYALNISKQGYLFHSENFAFEKMYSRTTPFMMDIALKPISVGEKIVLRNVFYKTDSFALDHSSRVELDKIVTFMQTNTTLQAEIGGHTDNTGTVQYNEMLSEQRAKTVVEYLWKTGISEERIRYRGYGMNQPVSTNDTDEGRAKNRRTELKILRK